MIKVISLDEAIGKRGPKILVYGDSGAGKTSLTPTLQGRKLIASAEHGLLSLRGAADVDVVEVDSTDTLRDLGHHAVEHGYDWLIVDSITEIAEVLLAGKKEGALDPRQAYGATQDAIGAAVRGLRDLACGVVCIAQQQKLVDDDSKRTEYRPLMPGSKLGPSLPYAFDEVFRLVVERDGTRRLLTANDGQSKAKDRSGRLDKYEPADLGAIVEKMIGGE